MVELSLICHLRKEKRKTYSANHSTSDHEKNSSSELGSPGSFPSREVQAQAVHEPCAGPAAACTGAGPPRARQDDGVLWTTEGKGVEMHTDSQAVA